MRLRRVIWKHYGIETPAQMLERHEFFRWLWQNGAVAIQPWMLIWEIRWR